MAVDDESAGGYWFAGEGTKARSVAVLDAMRDYRSAEAEMRKRTRESMNMNESDLLALRIITRSNPGHPQSRQYGLQAHDQGGKA